MDDLLREQKLHLKYVKQCDRVLRHSILFAVFIGVMFFLMVEFSTVTDDFSLLAIAFIFGFGVPVLYYNISVTILYHRFMRSLDGEEGLD